MNTKKILLAFVPLFLLGITLTACGDKSIRQSDRTPKNTDITSTTSTTSTTATTSIVELKPNPLPAETTKGAETVPAETGIEQTPAETVPVQNPVQTSPVPPAPQTETKEEFERQQEIDQQEIKQKREKQAKTLLEANQQILEDLRKSDPESAEHFQDWLYNLPTSPPTPEPRTPVDPSNSRQYHSSEVKFRIESNGEATLVSFIPNPTIENGKPVREIVVPEFYEYFDPITQKSTQYPLTTIDKYAFYNCDDLYSVVLSTNIHTNGEFSFSECDNLEALTIPRVYVAIPANSFCKNSPKFSLIARKYSEAESVAIKDNIPFTEYTV